VVYLHRMDNYVARKRGKIFPFTTCVKGKHHGIRPVFLPAGADCPAVAVPDAPLGLAEGSDSHVMLMGDVLI